MDNWRIGKGATMYYPVAVAGALLSVGDPHASQGDSELCGTAIECSLTGTFQLILHKKATLAGTPLEGSTIPMLETQDEWVVHGFSYPNYLAELGADAQSGDLRQVVGRPRACATRSARCASFLMTRQGPHRGRGDLADVGRRSISASPRWSTAIGASTPSSGRTSFPAAMPETCRRCRGCRKATAAPCRIPRVYGQSWMLMRAKARLTKPA